MSDAVGRLLHLRLHSREFACPLQRFLAALSSELLEEVGLALVVQFGVGLYSIVWGVESYVGNYVWWPRPNKSDPLFCIARPPTQTAPPPTRLPLCSSSGWPYTSRSPTSSMSPPFALRWCRGRRQHRWLAACKPRTSQAASMQTASGPLLDIAKGDGGLATACVEPKRLLNKACRLST